ncbi:FecR family protein [Steroidobacter agaridevorans]|uniref:FecR family protein n=1 Tax=Steroidobacter agaridevorans TaxID=2695856 RepID=UPI00132067F8|nr:FecR domain-containing protein [Steroidobacter agaridevorans]GFE88712.1 sensor [Steroidobacter agaridevorans]
MSGDVTRIKRECREWLALLQSGEANEADRARFSAWLRADPRHQRAYDGLRMLWRDISTLSQLKELEPVPPRPAAKTTRRFLPLAAAAAAAGLAIALLLSQPQSVQQPVTTAALQTEEYQTQLGEVRAIRLTDGSTLTLGARSHAIVSFSDSERRVRLEQGEAYFDVAKNPARPFHVAAPGTAVRVVGTRFDVRVSDSHVRVAVDEGVVAVNNRSGALTRGQRIDVLPDGAMTEVTQVDGSEVAAWREGRLVYDGATLAEVVSDLARYRPNVTLSSVEAGKLRVTAGLRVEQIEQFVDRLPDILPVRVTRTDDAITIDAS